MYFVVIILLSIASGIFTNSPSDTSDGHGTTHSLVTSHSADKVVEDRQLVSLSVLNSSGDTLPEMVDNTTCSATWFLMKQFSNGSNSCKCGSELGDIIDCHDSTERVDLLRDYCMTFSVDESMLVVGSCLYGEIKGNGYNPYYHLPSNSSELQEFCGRYHRNGQFCGKCEDGFALPVYSYDLVCVECKSNYAYNWAKFVAAAFFPLTLFFIVIVTFRIRITSGLMNAFILMSQIFSAPGLSRAYLLPYRLGNKYVQPPTSARVIISLYAIWNLDFFRLLYPSFCLHPDVTTIQILALDYIIAAYPLALLAVAYLLIKLQDYGFKIIVWMWRPFHRCFVRFRRDWNIKTSLIDAFATFLLLSYMKFLSVSFSLLQPTRIYNIHGQTLSKYYLYWDGTIEYFGREHLPYAILALTVVVVFNIFPLLLMCLYPSRWFHKCLNHCGWQSQALHTFMDAFQGCYKDGTNDSCDCRWFTGLYMFIQMLCLVMQTVTASNFWQPIFAVVLLVLFLLTALFKPYKSPVHNCINIIFVFVMMLFIITTMAGVMAFSSSIQFHKYLPMVTGLITLFPLIYIAAIIFYKLFGHQMCIRELCQKLCSEVFCCCKTAEDDFRRLLPERMLNMDEGAPLLAGQSNVQY